MVAEIAPETLAVFEILQAAFAGDARVVGGPEVWRDKTPEQCWAATATMCDQAHLLLQLLPTELQERLRAEEPIPDSVLAALAGHVST